MLNIYEISIAMHRGGKICKTYLDLKGEPF